MKSCLWGCRLDSDWSYLCSTYLAFPRIVKTYGSFCRENSSQSNNQAQIKTQTDLSPKFELWEEAGVPGVPEPTQTQEGHAAPPPSRSQNSVKAGSDERSHQLGRSAH